ncbi:MAG: hypothetical protein RL026_2646 [Pseudomonadota bacterium]|jgi:hypothetical protein
MDRHLATSRRGFLKGAGGLGGLAAALPAIASPLGPAARDWSATATVVLHDPRIALDPEVTARFAARGVRVIPLVGDPVRLWRSAELGALLADPSTRLLGLTRWSDYVILRGLAAGSRRYPQHEVLDAEQGHFTWAIA